MTTTLFFNGELNTTQAALADSTRDWATLVQTVEMVALALVARHAPRAVNPFPLTAAAAACAVVGASLAGVGMGAGSPALLTVGVCLTSSSTAWASILWIVLCSALRFRSMLVCFVAGGLARHTALALGPRPGRLRVRGRLLRRLRHRGGSRALRPAHPRRRFAELRPGARPPPTPR